MLPLAFEALAATMTADGTTSLKTLRSINGNPVRWLILGGVLLMGAVTIGTTVMVGNFRERALDNGKRELKNPVLLLARHFDQQLTDFRAIQEDLVAYVKSAGIDTSEQYSRRMSS